MFRVAICDDDIFICSELEVIIEEICELFEFDYSIKIFHDGETIINDIVKTGTYDIIFLDIRMGKLNGIEVAKTIRDIHRDEKTKIIYVSAIKEYVFDVFETKPTHFIVKPINKEKVEDLFKKIINIMREDNEIFIYKIGKRNYTIMLSDILFFESTSRKINMITTSGFMEFYGKISDLSSMNLRNFIQVHRSYLINATQIEKHTYNTVTMKNGQQISIGQSRRKDVMELLTKFTMAKLKEYNDV